MGSLCLGLQGLIFLGAPNLRNEWVLMRSARAITLAWWSLKGKAGETGSEGCRATAGKDLGHSQERGSGQELRTREGGAWHPEGRRSGLSHCGQTRILRLVI